jgi:hypothetical protein
MMGERNHALYDLARGMTSRLDLEERLGSSAERRGKIIETTMMRVEELHAREVRDAWIAGLAAARVPR